MWIGCGNTAMWKNAVCNFGGFVKPVKKMKDKLDRFPGIDYNNDNRNDYCY